MSAVRYTDEAKAKVLTVLDSNAGNVNKTARECALNESTVRGFIITSHKQERLRELREQGKVDLASLWEDVARLYIGRSLDDDAVEATRGKDAVMSGAIATDKMRLVLGQSTQITEQQSSKSTEFIETFKQIVQARQSQFPNLTIVQINLQVREEMTGRGLGSLLRLLPDVTEE